MPLCRILQSSLTSCNVGITTQSLEENMRLTEAEKLASHDIMIKGRGRFKHIFDWLQRLCCWNIHILSEQSDGHFNLFHLWIVWPIFSMSGKKRNGIGVGFGSKVSRCMSEWKFPYIPSIEWTFWQLTSKFCWSLSPNLWVASQESQKRELTAMLSCAIFLPLLSFLNTPLRGSVDLSILRRKMFIGLVTFTDKTWPVVSQLSSRRPVLGRLCFLGLAYTQHLEALGWGGSVQRSC